MRLPNFRRYRRFLRHRQIARAGAMTPMVPGRLGRGDFFNGDAPGGFVVDGRLNFFTQRRAWAPVMRVMSTRDSDARILAAIFDDLFRCLPPPKMTSENPCGGRDASTCAKPRSATGAAWNARRPGPG